MLNFLYSMFITPVGKLLNAIFGMDFVCGKENCISTVSGIIIDQTCSGVRFFLVGLISLLIIIGFCKTSIFNKLKRFLLYGILRYGVVILANVSRIIFSVGALQMKQISIFQTKMMHEIIGIIVFFVFLGLFFGTLLFLDKLLYKSWISKD